MSTTDLQEAVTAADKAVTAARKKATTAKNKAEAAAEKGTDDAGKLAEDAERTRADVEAAEEAARVARAELEADSDPHAAARELAAAENLCVDPLEVDEGQTVQFYLPLAGATEQLITAEVEGVYEPEDDQPPMIDIGYVTIAGRQHREMVRHVGIPARNWPRANRWCEMPMPTVPPDSE